jgi:hypothetical protein
MVVAGRKNAPKIPFHFRGGPIYVDMWAHEFTHWESSEGQKYAMLALEESLHSLLRKRDDLQAARGVFGRVSRYYPEVYPTEHNQEALFTSTHDFFNTYYSAASAMLSLIRRHTSVFGEAPTHSIGKFLKWWRPKGLFMEEAYPILEKARSFRAILDHKESHPPYSWETIDENGLTKIMLVGAPNANGGIPDGALKHPKGWAIMAPDEDLVVSALAVQLNALIREIGMKNDTSSALKCTWQVKPRADDPGHGYPVFAHRDGTVGEIFKREIVTEVTLSPYTSAKKT